MSDKLDEVLGLVPVEDAEYIPMDKVPSVVESSKNEVAVVSDTAKEVQDAEDQRLVRDTLREMIFKSKDMLDELNSIAVSTEHPRAFEVAAGLVKTITDVASKLGDNAKPKETKSEQGGTTNVQNNVYVSSEDLMKMIRDGKAD